MAEHSRRLKLETWLHTRRQAWRAAFVYRMLIGFVPAAGLYEAISGENDEA